MIDQPFPELSTGQRKVSRGRTMTEKDMVNFCMLTGNWLELHSNVEFAKHTQYGQRPTLAVIDQPEVDVIQLEGQWHT